MQIYVLTFESPSFKDVQRKYCGDIETECEFCIGGPRLKISSNFNELLKISSFKSSFLDFLIKEYDNIQYASATGEKDFCCSIDKKYTKFYSSIVWGSPWRRYRGNVSCKTCRYQRSWQYQKLTQSHLWFDIGPDSDSQLCWYI